MSNAHATENATAAHVDAIARAAGAATSHPTVHGCYVGHVAIHGTPETHTAPAGVLRALAALGVSRGEWRDVGGGFRAADLSDLSGEVRGRVVYSPAGASATLWGALSRPLACFAA